MMNTTSTNSSITNTPTVSTESPALASVTTMSHDADTPRDSNSDSEGTVRSPEQQQQMNHQHRKNEVSLEDLHDPALQHIPLHIRADAEEIRKRHVYVAGLPLDFDVSHFAAIMSEFGPLYVTRMVTRNRRVKLAQRAYAFAVYENPEDAAAAVEGVCGLEIEGVELTARMAITAALNTPPSSRGRKKRREGLGHAPFLPQRSVPMMNAPPPPPYWQSNTVPPHHTMGSKPVAMAPVMPVPSFMAQQPPQQQQAMLMLPVMLPNGPVPFAPMQ